MIKIWIVEYIPQSVDFELVSWQLLTIFTNSSTAVVLEDLDLPLIFLSFL